MAKLSFNIANHPELMEIHEAGKVLPAGVYRAHITDSQFRTSGAGLEYLELTFTVLGTEANEAGESGFAHKGRKVWENCNLNHPDEFPRKMATITIGGALQHTGVIKMQDTRELHGISLLIKLKAQENDPNRNCLDSRPWCPGIMADPNLVVDEGVRAVAAQAMAEPAAPVADAWGSQPAPVGHYPPQAQAAPTHPSLNHPSAYPAEGRGYPERPQAAPGAPVPTAGAYQTAMKYQTQPVGPNGGATDPTADDLPF